VIEQSGSVLKGRGIEKAGNLFIGGELRFYVLTQRVIAGAGFSKKSSALPGCALKRG
jgi:hypothetical protein